MLMAPPTVDSRFRAALRRVAGAPVRVYCADLAERRALPIYAAQYPDDPRPAAILWTARLYAVGKADDQERTAMRYVAGVWCAHVAPWERSARRPEAHACQAIAWCLEKRTSTMLWAVVEHIEPLTDQPREQLYAEVASALEAMPRKEVPA
jgi:hypothetical protein